MKKVQQILSILGLLFATMALLVVIFVKYYENDGMTVLDYVEQIRNEIVADAGQNVDKEDNKENNDNIETESAENASGDAASMEQSQENAALTGQPEDTQSTELVPDDTQASDQIPEDTESTEKLPATDMENAPGAEDSANTENPANTENSTNTEIPVDTENSSNIENPSYEPPSYENPSYVEFVPADAAYFEDALFIGDSRCVGIAEYGTIDNAKFFVLEGMAIRNVWKKTIDVKNVGETTLQNLLETQSFGKIYVMLGINELGYPLEDTMVKYQALLDQLHTLEPEAIIYVCSNLHVTAKQSADSDKFNNDNLNAMNQRLQAMTDNEIFYYLEVNEKFNDEEGNLMAECTSDQIHLYAKYYAEWSQWFYEKTIPVNNTEPQ